MGKINESYNSHIRAEDEVDLATEMSYDFLEAISAFRHWNDSSRFYDCPVQVSCPEKHAKSIWNNRYRMGKRFCTLNVAQL